MSQAHKEIIICPKCQAQGEFLIWDSINVDLNPELREAVLNESAFLYICPECGQRIIVPYSTLYHNMTHHFLLFFDYVKPDDYKYEPIAIPPFEGEAAKKYVYRHVTGLMQLKEKIFILEKDLNDRAIEHLKYSLSAICRIDASTLFLSFHKQHRLNRREAQIISHEHYCKR